MKKSVIFIIIFFAHIFVYQKAQEQPGVIPVDKNASLIEEKDYIQVYICPLHYVDATLCASILNEIVIYQDGYSQKEKQLFKIKIIGKGNRLIIAACQKDWEYLVHLIHELDKPL